MLLGSVRGTLTRGRIEGHEPKRVREATAKNQVCKRET